MIAKNYADCGRCATARWNEFKALGPQVEVSLEDRARCNDHKRNVREHGNVRSATVIEIDVQYMSANVIGVSECILNLGNEVEVKVALVEVEHGTVVVELDSYGRSLSVEVRFPERKCADS